MSGTLREAGLYERVYAVVRKIPRGRVATYGQIAAVVGGCGPRQVGYALAALADGSGVPWQRVVNRQGRVSGRARPGAGARQRERLEAEGVAFDLEARIDLDRYGWQGPPAAWLRRHGMRPPPALAGASARSRAPARGRYAVHDRRYDPDVDR